MKTKVFVHYYYCHAVEFYFSAIKVNRKTSLEYCVKTYNFII